MSLIPQVIIIFNKNLLLSLKIAIEFHNIKNGVIVDFKWVMRVAEDEALFYIDLGWYNYSRALQGSS